jgi:peptidoglycan/LPS O-acetylase OafA/YrhL
MKLLDSVFFPNDNKLNHVKSLDGLRGVAVLMVLLSHSSNQELYLFGMNFKGIGSFGVYLFFILSSYLLDRQIAQNLLKYKTNKGYWMNYTLRRFLRIYPLFIITLLIFYILNLLGFKNVISSTSELFYHLALLKGESIFWSIPVEFKYYILSPFLMIICSKILKWKKIKVTLFIVGLILLSILTQHYIGLDRISTFRFLPFFLIGTLISIYELIYFDNVPRQYKVINYLGGLSLIIIIVLIPSVWEFIFGNKDYYFYKSSYYLFFAIIWSIILISSKSEGFVKKIFEFKLIRFLGVVSFSSYLLHIPILRFVKSSNYIFEDYKFFAFISFTIIFSTISYLLIEKPLSSVRYNYKK